MVSSPNLSSSPRGTSYINSTNSKSASSITEIKKGGAQSATGADNSDTNDNGEMAAWMIESAQVAKDYVESIDKGQYAQSWSKGDQIFQHTITENEWTQNLNSQRKGLGKVKSRTLKLQGPSWNPRGLPSGPYMVVEYDTSFESAPRSTEILTLRRGPDGKWRILTYQIN
jgi:hypothetical protein